MPELPELEALALALAETLPGREIVGVQIRSVSLVKTYAPPIEELIGDGFSRIGRRGKWLLLGTRSGRTLAVHLLTGGRLRRTDGNSGAPRADGLMVRFADGGDLRVAEIGSKKQSAVHFVNGDGSDLVAHLGPEPLDPSFGVEQLASALGRQRQQVKSALADQRVLAGIGNAWSDEVLHAASISPVLLTTRLTAEQIGALHAALRSCLTSGIELGRKDNYLEKLKGESRPYLRVHNRKGQPCPTCGARLAAIHRGERQTTYCPTCQSDGRVYADRRLSRLLK